MAKEKIKTLKELGKIVRKLKKEGKKIVHCHGVFDLIHPGHIRHLSSAKKYGDILVVTITADEYVKKGPGRPIFKEDLRAEFLAALVHVDFVAINNSESAEEAIKKLKPDFYVKGPDYKDRKVPKGIPTKLTGEQEAIISVGGKLLYTDDIIFSSSKLINDYLESYPPKLKEFLSNFKSKYSADFIVEKLMTLAQLKILVVGDAIIDQYDFCLPMGKSSKEPIIVHKHIFEESYLGGALATANNVASLCKSVNILSVLGKKQSFESFILKKLKPEVIPTFFFRDDADTIIKRRFVDASTKQKLFQISMIKDDFIPEKVEKKILAYLKREINKFDLVIVNDFGHGMLTDRIIRSLCRKAKYLALNVQANSANYGFNIITKYSRADYVCIDEQELRLATHDKYSALEKLIKRIFKKMNCRDIIVTRGAEGSLSYSKDSGFIEVPSMTQRIVDRMGAGDTLFAITSPCVYARFDKEIVPFLGNVAGAIKVQNIGNRDTAGLAEITKFITRLLK